MCFEIWKHSILKKNKDEKNMEVKDQGGKKLWICFLDVVSWYWFYFTIPCFFENKPWAQFCMVTWPTLKIDWTWKIGKHVLSRTDIGKHPCGFFGCGQLCLGGSGCFLELCLQGSILCLKIGELLFGCLDPQQSGCWSRICWQATGRGERETGIKCLLHVHQKGLGVARDKGVKLDHVTRLRGKNVSFLFFFLFFGSFNS